MKGSSLAEHRSEKAAKLTFPLLHDSAVVKRTTRLKASHYRWGLCMQLIVKRGAPSSRMHGGMSIPVLRIVTYA